MTSPRGQVTMRHGVTPPPFLIGLYQFEISYPSYQNSDHQQKESNGTHAEYDRFIVAGIPMAGQCFRLGKTPVFVKLNDALP